LEWFGASTAGRRDGCTARKRGGRELGRGFPDDLSFQTCLTWINVGVCALRRDRGKGQAIRKVNFRDEAARCRALACQAEGAESRRQLALAALYEREAESEELRQRYVPRPR